MWKKIVGIFWKEKIFLVPLLLGGFMVSSLNAYEKPTLQKSEIVITDDAESENTETNMQLSEGVFDLEDGIYQGNGTGYGGTITVEVTIKDKKIESISIISAPGEGESFLNRAKAVITDMIKNQSMEVDTVSGATYSSRGIIEAVKNALTGQVSTSTPVAGTSANKAVASVGTVEENQSYKDGVYTGEAQGFGGTIKVQVTVKNGKIKSIKVLSASGETTSYFNKAKKLLKDIVSRQSTNVDTVSGATYSSNGLIQAVRNALSKAVDDNTKTNKKATTTVKTGTLPYVDGVYYGTGEGYAGEITVAILIRNHTLMAAVIIDTVDGDSYISRAESILDRVVKKQSAKVDTVSGATYSSRGIIEAIKNALKAAASGKTGLPAIDNPGQGTGEEGGTGETPETSEEGKIYKNGTYTESVVCTDGEDFKYVLDVEVTVGNDKITNVTIVDKTSDSAWRDNMFYINKVKRTLLPLIVAKGNPEGIDVVSGATYSSNATLDACRQALKTAEK